MDIGNDAVIFIMIKIASFSACRKEAEMKADIKWLDNPEVFRVISWKHTVIIVII